MTIKAKAHVRTPDKVTRWLNYLFSENGMTDRQIALKPYFAGIPPGTINSMRNHGYYPKKWCKKLNIILNPRASRFKIYPDAAHIENTLKSMRNHMTPDLLDEIKRRL